MEPLRIRTDEAVSGMVVAADIYSSSDQLILAKGTKLDDRKITKLRFYNIYGLYVYDKEPETEPHKEESYIEMLRSTRSSRSLAVHMLNRLRRWRIVLTVLSMVKVNIIWISYWRKQIGFLRRVETEHIYLRCFMEYVIMTT